MEIDSLTIQLTSLLALHRDDDANEDDIVFATLDYIRGAHAVAQMLLLEGRFPELQRCLNLCQAAFGEIVTSPAAASSEEAAAATAAAPSTTQDSSGPRSERVKAVGSELRPSLSPSSVEAAAERRRASVVLRSAEDHRVFSALASRTAQLQTQLEAAMQVRRGRDANYYLHKLGLGVKHNDADETLDKREAATSIRFFQRQRQQLPRAVPMALLLPQAPNQDAWGRCTQRSAARPPPPPARLSAPVQSERNRSASLCLPSLNIPGPCGSTRQHATSSASGALLGDAAPPPSPPERGIAIGRKSYVNRWKAPKRLPPLVTEGRTFCMDRYQAYDVAGGALHNRPQSNNHVGTLADKDGDVEDDGGICAAQQLYGTLNQNSIPLYAREVLEEPHLWSLSGSFSSASANWGSPPSSAAMTRPNLTASCYSTQLVSRVKSVDGADKHEEEGGPLVGGGGDVGGDAGGPAGFAPVQSAQTRFLLRTASPLLESAANSPVPALSSCSCWCANDDARHPAASAFTSGSHMSHPAQSPSDVVEAFTPRRRLLPVSTSALATASSATNVIASSSLLQPHVGPGVPSDDAHVATSATVTSMPTPRSAPPAAPSRTLEQLRPPSSATAVASLSSLTRLPAVTSAAAAAAARAVQGVRHTMQFAITSLKAQHQRSAQALEQCDELALFRLPYSAREALMASRARQAAHEYVSGSSSPGGDGGENSVRSVSPVSVGTAATPNCPLTAAQLTEEQVLPPALPSVDTAAVATAEQHQLQHRRLPPPPPLSLSPSQQLSPDAEGQLRELRVACEQHLAASESNVQEMEALWLAQHRQLKSRVALSCLEDSAEWSRSPGRHLMHRGSTSRRSAEQYSRVSSHCEGHARGAAPAHTTTIPPSPALSASLKSDSPVASTVSALAATGATGAGTRPPSGLSIRASASPQQRRRGSRSPACTLPSAARGTTAACPVHTAGAVSSEATGVSKDASEDNAVLLGATKTMRSVATVRPLATRAAQATQEGGDAAGAGMSVAPAAFSAPSPQQARHSGAGDAAGLYTYSAAVEASGPNTVEETLVAWRRTLQAMDSPSTATATEVVRGSGAEAGELNAAAACSFPSHTSCSLAATSVAPPPSRATEDVPRMRPSIRCAAAVVRGRRTQRFVCEALRQVFQRVLPGDLVCPAWRTDAAARPQPPIADLPNASLIGMKEAEASAKVSGCAAHRTVGSMARVMNLTSGSSIDSLASAGAARVLNAAAPSPWLPPSDFTSAGPSKEAVTSVIRHVNAAYRANATLLSIEDWTAVAPHMLARSLPLSVRAVRIQRWWRQRLAVRLYRQRRAAQEAYLVEEERRDAAALRLQRQIRVHWALKVVARRAAAVAARIEHRVAAERTTAKHSGSVDGLTDGSVAFGASNSLTTTPSSNRHLRRVVTPHSCGCSRGSSSSPRVRRARSVRITSQAGTDGSLARLRTFKLAAFPAATSGGVDKDASIFFRSARAAVAPDDVDRHVRSHRPRSPSKATTVETDATMVRTTAAPLSVHSETTSEQRPSTTRRAAVPQMQPELVIAAAQRIQRCYRHHLARLYTARLRREVEVLSAVVTRRAPLAAIRVTLTAAPLSAPTVRSLIESRSSDGVCAGAGELSDILTAASARELGEGSDTAVMRSLLDGCTGDVCEACLQRGLAARRHGDYKPPLERVSLRELQRIRQEREDEAAQQRQLHELEQRRKLEQRKRQERQVLEASKTIQRIGRGCRWRRWLRERELKARQRAEHHQVALLSCSSVKGIHSVQLVSSDGQGTQPVMSSEDEQYLQLAGGEAVTSHMILRLRATYSQWFGIATDPTSAQYIVSHCTPAQLATVPTIEAFVAAFASRAEVYNRYRHTCAKSLQLAWRLHRAQLHGRRQQGRIVSASKS
ncbi:conserved hypothetical protein [Leishmania major strain Friedlin]|uniref:Uncharacterized protein n=1 Tax=Leishmania major TaxID=5664 RepID=Q4QF54_LEIMA|nr:conserved hypothetical protein [Leishmania major strain Friedlin]CAG9571565.1 hypothetical_protein_-_conserved [Leishmania major strain Friedlin]CAJ03356.1 conserved hypothetical protein [Leishmania major strain Friedlin]|eukprot:XP_001682044.1 conserved hypothetical protein [Leishmania major strain Friedlin]